MPPRPLFLGLTPEIICLVLNIHYLFRLFVDYNFDVVYHPTSQMDGLAYYIRSLAKYRNGLLTLSVSITCFPLNSILVSANNLVAR